MKLAHAAMLPLLAASLFGCADESAADKPFVDPDQTLATAKADRISNYWTDIRGELTIGSTIVESIDFPSYYLGRTAELRAGQRYQVDVISTRKSLVNVYGAATGEVDGQPVFGAALVKTTTTRDNGTHFSSFAFDVPADGLYMLVYGPKNVWAADYLIEVTCLEGCLPADACLSDDACEPGEFCGNNGVRCIAAPCDASYDVCQAQREAGAACFRDGNCMDGLTCQNDVCTGGTAKIGETCTLTEQCADGFCGCAEQGCVTSVCKTFSKEGESCGGFRMAHLTTQCSTDFACVAPYDIIADIPGHCGAMTTVAAVVADPKKFDGRYIAIKGVIDPNAAFCTKMACASSNPCCNACSATLRVYDDKSQFGTEGIYVSEGGDALSCQGNECGWREACELTPGNYWVAGWFRLVDGVTPTLDVDVRYGWGY